jgi:cyclic di-GMP phosphodiesterase
MAGNAKILMFEPSALVREALLDVLSSAGYTVFEAANSAEARRVLHGEEIDLLVSDVGYNGASGMDVVNYVLQGRFGIDVVVMTSYTEIENVRRIVDVGVYDIIAKPIHAYNLLLSVQRALEKRRLSFRNRELQSSMEKKVKEKILSMRIHNQEKQQLLISIIRSLVSALEAKDKYTEGHSRRVADDALQMADTLGFSTGEIEEIHLAGLFHDIGKIGVSEAVLNKKGRLSDDEYKEIKEHPLISEKIVAQVPQFKRLARIVRSHHEFYDGSGYPDGARRDDIPVGARIMAVCDAFDAMTSNRPYRDALANERAAGIIRRNAGTQFDPDMVQIFLRMKGYIH